MFMYRKKYPANFPAVVCKKGKGIYFNRAELEAWYQSVPNQEKVPSKDKTFNDIAQRFIRGEFLSPQSSNKLAFKRLAAYVRTSRTKGIF